MPPCGDYMCTPGESFEALYTALGSQYVEIWCVHSLEAQKLKMMMNHVQGGFSETKSGAVNKF